MEYQARIIDYEMGELEYEETLALFQELLDSGLCWELQGHYGRMAHSLIENGLISLQPTKDNHDGK